MSVSLPQVRARLAARSRGELSPQEEQALVRDARILRRRLERLRALHPEIEVSLSPELDELASPTLLTASGP